MYRHPHSGGLKQVLILGMVMGFVFFGLDNRPIPINANEPEPVAPAAPYVTGPYRPGPLVAAEPEPDYSLDHRGALTIPGAGVRANIVDAFLDGVSWDIGSLGANIGHLEGTAWDGQPGNIVLAGHVETTNGGRGVFASLEGLAEGDLIVLTVGEEERQYRVSQVARVAPDDLTPLYPSQKDRLTLITCDSYDFFWNVYNERVVVVAERVTNAANNQV